MIVKGKAWKMTLLNRPERYTSNAHVGFKFSINVAPTIEIQSPQRNHVHTNKQETQRGHLNTMFSGFLVFPSYLFLHFMITKSHTPPPSSPSPTFTFSCPRSPQFWSPLGQKAQIKILTQPNTNYLCMIAFCGPSRLFIHTEN